MGLEGAEGKPEGPVKVQWWGNDFCGSAGERRAKRGAKAAVRHAARRYGKHLAKRLLIEGDDAQR
jgi:hypothetical protein